MKPSPVFIELTCTDGNHCIVQLASVRGCFVYPKEKRCIVQLDRKPNLNVTEESYAALCKLLLSLEA